MSNCKYSIGQTLSIGMYVGEEGSRKLVVRSATVVNTETKFHKNNSRIWLRVAHDDCYEDMRVDTRWLTRMVKNAESAAAPA